MRDKPEIRNNLVQHRRLHCDRLSGSLPALAQETRVGSCPIPDAAAPKTRHPARAPGADRAKPARYCIRADLVKPDCLVEIAAVAHID